MSKKIDAYILTAFAAGLVAAVIIRVYELINLIEVSTGFYKNSSPAITALNLLLLILTLLLLCLFFIRSGETPNVTRKSIAGAVVCYIVAICFLAASIEQINNLIQLKSTGYLLISFTEILSAVFFFILGAIRSSGRKFNLAIPALLPIAWGIIILVVSYMQYTTITNISQYLLNVLRMVFVLIFIYYNSMSAGNIKSKRGFASFLAFGLPAVLFCFVSAVPNYIVYFFKLSSIKAPSLDDLLFTAIGIYIIFILLEPLFSGSGWFKGVPEQAFEPEYQDNGLQKKLEDNAENGI